MKDEFNTQSADRELALESVISAAVQLPGVRVDRQKFLAEVFAAGDFPVQTVLDMGPIAAGVPQDTLALLSRKLILKRTSQSSAASFVAGLPGGLALAATIPADVLQFFGMALRLAQELSYLYGADDLWQGGQLDDERVKNQLLLYCGAMFGVSGAVSGVRVLSSQIAKTALKKLPQQALTKTFWYPILKQIGKAIGVKITKSTVAKGASKAIPVLGGVISGGLNFASMMPMANRLQSALDSAALGYTDEDLEQDIIEITGFASEDDEESASTTSKEHSKKPLSTLFGRKKSDESPVEEVFETISRLAALKEQGILTQEEFDAKKAELLARL